MWHLRWGELQAPPEVAFEIRPKPCGIGPCAQSSLYQSKLAESLGRTVLQIHPLHPRPCQISPLASHFFLSHFLLSFASIFYLTLRSCLELLPLYGNMLYLHNNIISFMKCRNNYTWKFVIVININMNILINIQFKSKPESPFPNYYIEKIIIW